MDVSEKELCRIAKDNGWYDERRGMYMRDNGKLLYCFGVEYTHSQHNDLDSIQKEITLSHRVMVSINHAKLAGGKDVYNQAVHSVVVNDMDERFVYIANPGTGHSNEQILRSVFIHAWEDSCCYMLSTCEAALFKYNSQSKSMVELFVNK